MGSSTAAAVRLDRLQPRRRLGRRHREGARRRPRRRPRRGRRHRCPRSRNPAGSRADPRARASHGRPRPAERGCRGGGAGVAAAHAVDRGGQPAGDDVRPDDLVQGVQARLVVGIGDGRGQVVASARWLVRCPCDDPRCGRGPAPRLLQLDQLIATFLNSVTAPMDPPGQWLAQSCASNPFALRGYP